MWRAASCMVGFRNVAVNSFHASHPNPPLYQVCYSHVNCIETSPCGSGDEGGRTSEQDEDLLPALRTVAILSKPRSKEVFESTPTGG